MIYISMADTQVIFRLDKKLLKDLMIFLKSLDSKQEMNGLEHRSGNFSMILGIFDYPPERVKQEFLS